ncbi:MAG TPA: phospholipase A [Burkholderiales bacterium]|nr:phospholipase A [Burkholderiales bacterium]
MRRAALSLLLLVVMRSATAQEWLVAAPRADVAAGEPFELVISAPAHEALPDELRLRARAGIHERILPLRAVAPSVGAQRRYAATMPPGLAGPVRLELAGQASSALVLLVTARPDALRELTAARADAEPPISEHEPIYFVAGPRGGWTARFQISFKYRLFDLGTGFGRDQPWLSGLYFGYTQNSLWDLSSPSRVFRDTSYRPSLFWDWNRADEKTFVDAARVGLEHESNGRDGIDSRSIDTAFARPAWRWRDARGREAAFLPKIYGYLNRGENPDIPRYRGHVDWLVRYDAAGEWIAAALARRGTAGKGSLQLDLSWRARDLRFGPIGGYLHAQFFSGYGEDLLEYNARTPWQLRLGFAIVP